jgi:hypothetical protein
MNLQQRQQTKESVGFSWLKILANVFEFQLNKSFLMKIAQLIHIQLNCILKSI